MIKIFWIVVGFALVVGSVVAKDAPTVHQTFKPGDAVHFLIEFEGKPELEGITLNFGLQDPMKKDQSGFAGQFPLYHLKAVSPGIFEIDGVIPKNAASGTYQLNRVDAVHDPGSRVYSASEFPKVTLNVRNGEGYVFPPEIKAITAK